jgi:hypothetical protein
VYLYSAYGLTIQSELEVAAFLPGAGLPNVRLRIDRDRPLDEILPLQVLDEAWCLQVKPQRSIAYVKDTALFEIFAGQEVIVYPVAQGSQGRTTQELQQAIQFYLVGMVMSIVLYQRGFLVLHASAVETDQGAIAFLGESGQGKSSTAALFQHYGYRVLTDDVAPVSFEAWGPLLTPGLPQIKLDRAIAEALGHKFDDLAHLHPAQTKRGYRFGHQAPAFANRPLPLRRLYVLADGPEFRTERLSPAEGVMQLIRHSRPTTLFQSGGPAHFLQCSNLANQCEIYRLERPRDLSRLQDFVWFVAADLLPQIDGSKVISSDIDTALDPEIETALALGLHPAIAI